MRRVHAVLLCLALVGGPAGSAPEDPDLASGIALVKEGDFEAALPKLDAAVRRLETGPKPSKELARACLYLGITYLELEQELSASSRFREAVTQDPDMRLDPRQFSPRVIRFFEAARREVAAAAPLGAAPAATSKRRLAVPLILLGGGAALAGIAVAAGGGGATTSTSTTTTTTSTTTTTTTTTTTLPAACQYQMSPALQSFPDPGGSGSCQVTTSRDNCAWRAESTEDWVQITAGASGTGSGRVSFRVAEKNSGGARIARIRLRDGPDASCQIQQGGQSLGTSPATIFWSSDLDVPGGRGQVVLNGVMAVFPIEGRSVAFGEGRGGVGRIEAVLLAATGRAGTWRFEMGGAFEPGSLRVLAGQPLEITGGSVVFRLMGAPGERIVFAFRTSS